MPKMVPIDVEDRWDSSNEDEHLWWPRIMWIDPGVTSGVATFWFDPRALFDRAPLPRVLLAYSESFLSGPELGPGGQVGTFLRMRAILSSTPGLAIGCESFSVRQLNSDPGFLAPVRIRAATEQMLSLERDSPELHIQAPADALGTFTNDRLRRMGLHTPGPDHKNDAKRHALLWIRKVGAAGRDAFRAQHGEERGWWEE